LALWLRKNVDTACRGKRDYWCAIDANEPNIVIESVKKLIGQPTKNCVALERRKEIFYA